MGGGCDGEGLGLQIGLIGSLVGGIVDDALPSPFGLLVQFDMHANATWPLKGINGTFTFG